MARMYSRKKGQSGSKKPDRTKNPEWVKQVPAEVEKLVMRLGDRGIKPAQIGVILRDQYGIPDVRLAAKKTITEILKENNMIGQTPSDLEDLINRAKKIKKHFDENKQDMDAKRGLQLTESKIRRLAKYYKRVGKLPAEWKYGGKKAT
ncbi:MAG: 30S ribosomal protein S15, partial [archaeon]